MEKEQPSIVVALSGGGQRAALFGLGVLLYLVDSGLNRQVETISSVSGGSITNGFVARQCNFRSVDPKTFDTVASELLQRIVRRGLFHRSGLVIIYFSLLGILAALTVSTVCFGWPIPARWWVTAILLSTFATLFLFRGMVVAWQFSSRFFKVSGQGTRLNELHRDVEHIFCTTDLTSCAPFYFSTWQGGYMYSPALGFAEVGGTLLSTAVRASAAFPGGIPPKRFKLPNVRYSFRLSHREAKWQVEHTSYRKAGDYQPKVLFLADGGVWNNLGTQAVLEDELRRGTTEGNRDARIIVANASAPMRAARFWRIHLPLVGEFAALSRSLNIVNLNTVAPRIDRLREVNNCVVVSINDIWDRALESVSVPVTRKDSLTDAEFEDVYGRSRETASLENLFLFHEELLHETVARLCGAVPTTLGRVDRDTACRLMIHAYQNAQAEMFARFGVPPVSPRPDQARFTRLIPP